MKIKFTLLLVFTALGSRSSEAQTATYGVLGSYGHYRFNRTQSQIGQYVFRASGAEALDMWRVGAFSRISSVSHPNWSLQLEAYRSGRTAPVQLENITPDPRGYPDWNISSMYLTVRRYEMASLVSVKPFGGPIRLIAGPVVGYSPRRELLRLNADWPENSVDYPYRQIEIDVVRSVNRTVLNFQTGIGLDIRRTTLDIRRETAITPVIRQVSHNNQAYRTRLTGNTWLLTLGVRILDSKRK